MLGKNKTQIEQPCPTVSPAPPSAPTAEELDRLYQLKLVHTVPAQNAAQRMMAYFEKEGIDPIDVNPNWYIYGLQPRRAPTWKDDSCMNPDEAIPLYYAFPLPYKALKPLRKFLDTFGLCRSVCNLLVASPNPHLGIRPNTEQQLAVRADPMLIAFVKCEGREYAYNLATWDLGLDLSQEKEKEVR